MSVGQSAPSFPAHRPVRAENGHCSRHAKHRPCKQRSRQHQQPRHFTNQLSGAGHVHAQCADVWAVLRKIADSCREDAVVPLTTAALHRVGTVFDYLETLLAVRLERTDTRALTLHAAWRRQDRGGDREPRQQSRRCRAPLAISARACCINRSST
jgi:hypothetical protein